MDKLTWKDVPIDVRDRILSLYEKKRDLSDFCEALGMSKLNLERRCRAHREYTDNLLRREDAKNTSLLRDLLDDIEPVFSVAQISHFRPPPPLTDLDYTDSGTDQALWIDKLAHLRDTVKNITVMHLHDIHAPFQNMAALNVAYDLVEYTQPDVIVVGSDTMDFALLGSFDRSPDMGDDELDVLEAFWPEHIREIRRRAPNAILVFIYGNHEYRILRYLEKNAPAIRKSVLRAFIHSIRCGGEVLYIGEVDNVRIGPLQILHGKRTSQNPAKATWADVGGHLWVQFGHVHRLDTYINLDGDYPTGAVASGCLANPPHYVLGWQNSVWKLGTAIMEVDLTSRDVKIDNLLFDNEKGIVSVRFERKLFSSDKSRATWRAA
jgi:hypothetical protein